MRGTRGDTKRRRSDLAGSFYCTGADPVLGFAHGKKRVVIRPEPVTDYALAGCSHYCVVCRVPDVRSVHNRHIAAAAPAPTAQVRVVSGASGVSPRRAPRGTGHRYKGGHPHPVAKMPQHGSLGAEISALLTGPRLNRHRASRLLAGPASAR